MYDFSKAAGYSGGVIPHGTLAVAALEVQGLKKSESGNLYLDLAATIISGPFGKSGKRKVFGRVMLTADGGQAPSQVGFSQVKAILEGLGRDPVANPDAFRFQTPEDVARAIHGARVGIRIHVRKDDASRNELGLFISPSAASGTKNYFDQLQRQLAEERGEVQPQAAAQAKPGLSTAEEFLDIDTILADPPTAPGYAAPAQGQQTSGSAPSFLS